MHDKPIEITEEEVLEFIIVNKDKEFSIFYEEKVWYAYYLSGEDDLNVEIIEDEDYSIFEQENSNSIILSNGYVLTKDFLLDLKKKTTNNIEI